MRKISPFRCLPYRISCISTFDHFGEYVGTPTVCSTPNTPHRDFQAVRNDLEDAVTRLKSDRDPKRRKKLLQKLRLLLQEADRLITAESEGRLGHKSSL